MFNFRTIIAALAVVLTVGASSAARADEGTVTIQFFKGGWVVGGSFGKGVLNFRDEMYGLSVGGLSYGLTFGASQTTLQGRVRNIRHASDVEGVYAAGGAGAAIIKGAQAVVLTNQKGAILELSGTQTGLMLNLDLSGLALTIQ